MRTIRYFFAAATLASMLSFSTFGGDIHTGIAPQPTPTPEAAEGVMSTPVAGDISTPSSEEVAADEVLAEAVLRLVQGALSLL